VQRLQTLQLIALTVALSAIGDMANKVIIEVEARPGPEKGLR